MRKNAHITAKKNPPINFFNVGSKNMTGHIYLTGFSQDAWVAEELHNNIRVNPKNKWVPLDTNRVEGGICVFRFQRIVSETVPMATPAGIEGCILTKILATMGTRDCGWTSSASPALASASSGTGALSHSMIHGLSSAAYRRNDDIFVTPITSLKN